MHLHRQTSFFAVESKRSPTVTGNCGGDPRASMHMEAVYISDVRE
jgi:hypothetical protein